MRVIGGDSSGIAHMVGATGGVQLGNRWGLMMEVTYMMDLTSDDWSMFQVAGGLFFGGGRDKEAEAAPAATAPPPAETPPTP